MIIIMVPKFIVLLVLTSLLSGITACGFKADPMPSRKIVTK